VLFNGRQPLNDRGLFPNSIQDEIEDEPLQFKRPIIRARARDYKKNLFKAYDTTSN